MLLVETIWFCSHICFEDPAFCFMFGSRIQHIWFGHSGFDIVFIQNFFDRLLDSEYAYLVGRPSFIPFFIYVDLANVVWTPAFVPGLLPEFGIFGLDTLCFVPGLVPEQTGQVQKNWTAQPAENHSGIVVFYRLFYYVVNEYIKLFTCQSLITEPFSG